MIMKSCFRHLGMFFVRLLGSKIHDAHDGEYLGKALICTWKGRVYLMGYEGVPLRMVCLPQDRLRYWRIDLGFTKAGLPDYGKCGVDRKQ
jgi:hypothetical protein